MTVSYNQPLDLPFWDPAVCPLTALLTLKAYTDEPLGLNKVSIRPQATSPIAMVKPSTVISPLFSSILTIERHNTLQRAPRTLQRSNVTSKSIGKSSWVHETRAAIQRSGKYHPARLRMDMPIWAFHPRHGYSRNAGFIRHAQTCPYVQ